MTEFPSKEALLDMARGLRDLVESAPTDKARLDAWYEQRRAFETHVLRGNALTHHVPHFLWHYLADADIRLKDAEYAGIQNRRIALLIEALERGVMPDDDEIDDDGVRPASS